MSIKFVIKRSGDKVQLLISEMAHHIEALTRDLAIDTYEIIGETLLKIHDGITTREIDEESCAIALGKYFVNKKYAVLAARLAISSYTKDVIHAVSKFVGDTLVEKITRSLKSLLRPNLYSCFLNRARELQELYDRFNGEFSYTAFFKLRESFYLLPNETIAYAMLRVVVSLISGLANWDLTAEQLEEIALLYRAVSNKYFTFSTPTYLNSGYTKFQGASCIVINVQDSIEEISTSQAQINLSSKYGCGIGISLNLRSKGSHIHGTNGYSGGLAPLTRVYDAQAKHIDQGGAKRPGAVSVYIADWHADLLEVLDQRSKRKKINAGHNIHYALWCSDLFLRAYIADADWYFFSPDDAIVDNTNLEDLYDRHYTMDWSDRSGEFTQAYFQLVESKKYKSVMKARVVAEQIAKIIAESGLPYVCGKDAFNRCRPQNDVIRSSNLCTEIGIPSGWYWDSVLQRQALEVGVCNLSSVCIPKFILKKSKHPEIWQRNVNRYNADRFSTEHVERYYLEFGNYTDHLLTWTVTKFDDTVVDYFFNEADFEDTVRGVVRTLNRLIDINFYALEETRFSNMKRRPLAIGKLGVADALLKLGLAYTSEEGCRFNAQMQEALYFYAVDESANLARIHGPHQDFEEYPAARGLLQPHLFALRTTSSCDIPHRYNWDSLADKASSGLYNSVLTANMPTGNVSLIMGMSPCTEPYESNIYKHSAMSKDLVIINERLRKDIRLLIRDDHQFHLFIKRLPKFSGKVSEIPIPGDLTDKNFVEKVARFRELYKVAKFEITTREVIRMHAAAQPFCDQAQSMNLWREYVSTNNFWNDCLYAARLGLKTWVYYTKTQSANKEEVCHNCIV